MHYKTKEAAVKKHGALKDDSGALQAALEKDPNNYNDAEIKEILDAILNPQEKAKSAEKKVTGPNAEILDKLREFDYESMRGEVFKNYCQLVQGLIQDKSYDFELYLVEPIRKVRYKGVKDSPVDIVGFQLKQSRPLHTTRIPVRHALQTNGTMVEDPDGDFFEVKGAQFSQNGRYYLLKK